MAETPRIQVQGSKAGGAVSLHLITQTKQEVGKSLFLRASADAANGASGAVVDVVDNPNGTTVYRAGGAVTLGLQSRFELLNGSAFTFASASVRHDVRLALTRAETGIHVSMAQTLGIDAQGGLGFKLGRHAELRFDVGVNQAASLPTLQWTLGGGHTPARTTAGSPPTAGYNAGFAFSASF